MLHKINLDIPIGTSLGIIGETGSGKSTILDILMALLEPTSGKLLVDDLVISDDNKQTWQYRIGHVPQKIYLSDSSIAENIAINLDSKKINQNRLYFFVAFSCCSSNSGNSQSI